MGIGRYMTIDQEGLEDRVYRLHYNELQNRCDKLSLICGLVGSASSAIFLNYSRNTIIGKLIFSVKY